MSLKRKMRLIMVLPVVVLLSLAGVATSTANDSTGTGTANGAGDNTATAIFAGGCFWCVESDFDHVPGVLETVSGYSGGETTQPTYKNHHQGRHREVVRISYDPKTVSYGQLLDIFWRSVDPTDAGGQFCDRGHSYTTAIYSVDENQRAEALESLNKLKSDGVLKDSIVTAIEPASEFWPAEDYHQDYYLKNPLRYKYYRAACGRDKRVKKVWGNEAHAGIEKS